MLNLLREFLEFVTRIPDQTLARFDDEGLCRRCGRCCVSATRVKGRMVMLPGLPCKYLVRLPQGPAACQIYEQRELTGFCHRITRESIRKELFPPDCPYVQGITGYQGKIELPPADFEAVTPILRNLFRLADRPEFVRKSDWDNFLAGLYESS
jgi:hypothetical protein